MPKMSEFVKNKNLTRDKNGFLNCQLCLRRFISRIGLENHFKLEHSDDTLNRLEIQQAMISLQGMDAIQKVKIGIPNHLFDESMAIPKDHESFDKNSNLHISVLEKKHFTIT